MAHWRIVNGETKHIHSDLSEHETEKRLDAFASNLMGLASFVKYVVEVRCKDCGAFQKSNDCIVNR